MGEVRELERELDAARKRVQAKRERRERQREAARDADATGDRLREAAEEAKVDRDTNREQIVAIRRRLEQIQDDGVDPDDAERVLRLSNRIDREVDENEELTAILHRLLPRLDEVEHSEAHHRRLIERFGNEFQHAVRHREKVHDELREVRRDRRGGTLETPFFVVAEFDCHDGTPVPRAAIPALKANVHEYLLPLRAVGGSVHVNSGYRTEAYNRQVGGASNSIHIYDQHPNATAVDHWAERMAPATVQNWHDAHTHPDGMGRYSSFTHVDNRRRIGWAFSRWWGP